MLNVSPGIMQTQTVFLVLILNMHHQLKSLSQRSFHALLKKDGETAHLKPTYRISTKEK